MSEKNYWHECVAIACDEAGVVATDDQIARIAADVQSSHENYGMAFYQPRDNPLSRELADTKRLLEIERGKTVCRNCNGTGRIQSYGGTFMSDSQCDRCRGEGKV
jgi:hypothetical protein